MTQKINALEMLAKLDPESIEERIDELDQELKALRVLLRAIRPRATRKVSRKASSDATTEKVGESSGNGHVPTGDQRTACIVTYLEAAGPMTTTRLADALNIPRGSITAAVDKPQFKRLPDGRVDLKHGLKA